jgi:hypothetical protein
MMLSLYSFIKKVNWAVVFVFSLFFGLIVWMIVYYLIWGPTYHIGYLA